MYPCLWPCTTTLTNLACALAYSFEGLLVSLTVTFVRPTGAGPEDDTVSVNFGVEDDAVRARLSTALVISMPTLAT